MLGPPSAAALGERSLGEGEAIVQKQNQKHPGSVQKS